MKPTLYNTNRVLAHEIGHFIASHLCYKEWRIYKPNDIELEVVESDEIEGRSSLIQPDEVRVDAPIEHPPQFVACAMYGCILESIYSHGLFSECFTVDANGDKDFQSIKRVLPFKHIRESVIALHALGVLHSKELYKLGFREKLNASLFSQSSLKVGEKLVISDPMNMQNLDNLASQIEPHFYSFVEKIGQILNT